MATYWEVKRAERLFTKYRELATNTGMRGRKLNSRGTNG